MMARKITEKQQKELDYIKEWCLTILNFMIRKNSNTPIITQTKNVILETYNSQNIKGLAARDHYNVINRIRFNFR